MFTNGIFDQRGEFKGPPSTCMIPKIKMKVISDDFKVSHGDTIFNILTKDIHIPVNGITTDIDNVTIWILFVNSKIWLKEIKFLNYPVSIWSRSYSWDCQYLLILPKSSSKRGVDEQSLCNGIKVDLFLCHL
jgi:hypothetical protein